MVGAYTLTTKRMLKQEEQANIDLLNMLETAASTVKKVRKAYQRDKELEGTLGRYHDQLRETIDIIHVAQKESDLKTATLDTPLRKMGQLVEQLLERLGQFNPMEKGTSRRVLHQLVHGSKDERLLSGLIDEIAQEKTNMILHLQIASVGLVRTMSGNMTANAEAINRIDRLLQETLGEG